MKKLVLLCVLTAFMACSEHETTYSVDSSLEPYVTQFYQAGAARGVTVSRNLVAELTDFKAQASVDIKVYEDQNYLYANKTLFNYRAANGYTSIIEAEIYKKLAGLFMKRNVEMTAVNDSNREAYFDQIFK
jgi:hypothetical protein